MQRLALICPTRGRPDRIKDFIESVHKTAAHPERIECLLYVDDDDPQLEPYQEQYRALTKTFPAIDLSLTIGPAVGAPVAGNVLVKKTDAPVIVCSNDDQVYIDSGWDDRLDVETAKYPDGIYCIWFNDDWESKNFCTFPIISRKWVDTLGYLQFPFFEHFFTDSWLWMLAKAVDRAFYIDDVLVEHRHWKSGKAEMDDTYERNTTGGTDSRFARDRKIIDKFERYFLADVEALKKVMS